MATTTTKTTKNRTRTRVTGGGGGIVVVSGGRGARIENEGRPTTPKKSEGIVSFTLGTTTTKTTTTKTTTITTTSTMTTTDQKEPFSSSPPTSPTTPLSPMMERSVLTPLTPPAPSTPFTPSLSPMISSSSPPPSSAASSCATSVMSASTFASSSGAASSSSWSCSNSGRSSFKTALSSVPVPPKLLEGVRVFKVGTGGRTKSVFLTLSEDKFTIYVTSSKVKNGRAGNVLMRPLMRKVRSLGSPPDDGDGGGSAVENERAIDIGAVDRIQRGQNTLRFELARKAERQLTSTSPKRGGQPALLDSSRSFSIIFRGERTLDLMIQEGDNREEMLDALDRVIEAYNSAKVLVGNDVLLLRYIWLDVDKDKSNTINKDELGKVLDRINFYMKRSVLDKEYDKFAKMIGIDRSGRRRGLTFDQCVTFLHKIKRDTWQVKPVNQLFFDLFGEFMKNGKQRTKVSAESFLQKFLIRKQGEKRATIEQVRALFLRLNQLEIANVAKGEVNPKLADRYICRDRFEAYLVSRENDVFDPNKERFDPDSMSSPLSAYWINTSHNTYLKGDQLTSQSSVEMYMNALYRGCRCVEIDIWDGERDTSEYRPIPIVYHGRTMTTKIPFSDIIKSIKVFLNFNPESFPVILSLENHCSIPYQEVMAEQLMMILGSRLYIPDEASLRGNLPSPNSLKGMVILKGRRPLDASIDEEMDDDTDDDEQPLREELAKKASRPAKIAPQLAKLTLFHGLVFKNFGDSNRYPTHFMHSFSESKVRKICKQGQKRNWTVYNQTHMSRTFPSGSRVGSSNYNPMLAWATGCQMVALNFQTPDVPLRINDGRFRQNGGCGYVLKPPTIMMQDDVSPAPVELSVRILSGSCLPKPKGQRRGECIDPYVKVSLIDVDDDVGKVESKSYTTIFVGSNGFFPIWNQEKFKFVVENGTVAIVQITVMDKDVGKKDDFIASASIPISCLRQGIRSVQLFDECNTRSGAFDFASLLIEVKLKQLKVQNGRL